jgi:hypothetical protein
MKTAAQDIKSAFSGPHATGALYIGLLGLFLSDLIPTPADAVYFNLERKLRDDWKSGSISAKQYWTRETTSYYGLNALWWLLVIVIATQIPGSARKKMNIALAIIGVGAVVAVIHRNIQKDIRIQELEKDTPSYAEKFINRSI